jgi:hypothetical protein
MNSVYPGPGPSGFAKKMQPVGDDRLGMRALYGNGGSEVDLAGLMAKRTTPGNSYPVYSPDSAARGSQVTIEDTWSNFGTSYINFFLIYFYLSTNDYISTYDRYLGYATASANPGYTDTFSVTLTIPADIAPGTYYLGYLVDPGNGWQESDEFNNIQPLPRPITIY